METLGEIPVKVSTEPTHEVSEDAPATKAPEGKRMWRRLRILTLILGIALMTVMNAVASYHFSPTLNMNYHNSGNIYITTLYAETDAYQPAGNDSCVVLPTGTGHYYSGHNRNHAVAVIGYDNQHPGSASSPYRTGIVVLFSQATIHDPVNGDFLLYNNGYNDHDVGEGEKTTYTTSSTTPPTVTVPPGDTSYNYPLTVDADSASWWITSFARATLTDDTGEDWNDLFTWMTPALTTDLTDTHTFHVKTSCT